MGTWYNRAAYGTAGNLQVGMLLLTNAGQAPISMSSLWRTQNVSWQGGYSVDGVFYYQQDSY